jgi:hypothetical protein
MDKEQLRSWMALEGAACLSALAGQDAQAQLSKHVAAAGFPVQQGALYVANCGPEGDSFACRQYRMQFDPRQGMSTVEFKPVLQSAARAVAPSVKAAVVDRTHGQAFLHAACTGSYIVTDLKSGSARIFGLPQGMQCLQSLVVDDVSGGVLALAGKAVSDGELMEPDNSTFDWLVELSATGVVQVRSDLRGKVDPVLFNLSRWREMVSFDSNSRTLLTPLFRADDTSGPRFTLVVDVDSGDTQVLGWKFGLQHQFYDRAADATVVYDCGTPGFERFDGFTPEASFTPLFSVDLADANSPDNRCSRGFLGADFDPAGRKHFMLVHKQADFFVAVSDLAQGRFAGLFPAGVTAATFHSAERDLPPKTYFSLQYVPASVL